MEMQIIVPRNRLPKGRRRIQKPFKVNPLNSLELIETKVIFMTQCIQVQQEMLHMVTIAVRQIIHACISN